MTTQNIGLLLPGKENVQENLLDRLWQPDWSKTFARVTITPIRRGNQVVYHYGDEIELRPYPNPLRFGGMWGSGTYATMEEAERGIAQTQGFLDRMLKRRGITLVLEVIRNPEMTEPEWKNDQVYQHAAEQPAQKTRAQLSLF